MFVQIFIQISSTWKRETRILIHRTRKNNLFVRLLLFLFFLLCALTKSSNAPKTKNYKFPIRIEQITDQSTYKTDECADKTIATEMQCSETERCEGKKQQQQQQQENMLRC